MTERAGQWFGTYQALDVVEQGETAVVYRGYQPSLGRTVAIRVLPHSRNHPFAARFQREARAVAQLEHHNILPIYDYGEQDGMLYVVTQHVEHDLTLRDILGEPMEPLAALRLISGVLEGLDYAHRHGVIHRNIKPASILLPLPEWPVLADFGIARFEDEDQTMTMPGISLESARYMAPEFVENQPTDARTDIYSLGAVLYHMLVGHPPFEAATPLAVLQQHAAAPLPDPREEQPALPESVVSLLAQALAKAPDERFPTARAMLEAVQHSIAQIELSHGDQQIQQMYQAGVQAFAHGDWSRALDQLRQVQELSSQHSSAQRLIAFAEQAQRRAEQQAQHELARLQKQPALSPEERSAITTWSNGRGILDAAPREGTHEPRQVNRGEQAMPPFVGRSRLSPVSYIAAIIVLIVLVMLLLMFYNNTLR